jgi:hypothetical protein
MKNDASRTGAARAPGTEGGDVLTVTPNFAGSARFETRERAGERVQEDPSWKK